VGDWALECEPRGQFVKGQQGWGCHERNDALMHCCPRRFDQPRLRNDFDRRPPYRRECLHLAQTLSLPPLGQPDALDPPCSHAQRFLNRMNPAQHMVSVSPAGASDTGGQGMIRTNFTMAHRLSAILSDETYGMHGYAFTASKGSQTFGGLSFHAD
jgi:hypothetical protein